MTTDIVMVLDRSGSMETIAEDTIGGVNRFLTDQQAVQAPATFTLVQFDHEYEVVYHAETLLAVAPLTARTFVPRGSTALLDAIGRTIDDTGRRLQAMPDTQRPDKVLFVIVTDGHENASHEFSRQQVFDRIAHQRDVYQWEFVYLGANQDAIDVAEQINIPLTHAVTYTASAAGTRAVYDIVSDKVATLRSSVRGSTMTAFTPEERAETLTDD